MAGNGVGSVDTVIVEEVSSRCAADELSLRDTVGDSRSSSSNRRDLLLLLKIGSGTE